MELETLDLKKVIPYKNNPRNNDNAEESVEASIKQCTYINPIIVDEDNIVLAGHTRLKALKKLGYKKCQVLRVKGLTEEQKKKFRLLDNKTNEFADWDSSLLALELKDLNFENFDFKWPGELLSSPEPKIDEMSEEDDEDDKYYGDERERTFEAVNLNDYNPFKTAGKYDMPILKTEDHIPKDLISFNYMLSSDDYCKGVHFYIDDYQFERIWNNPHGYMERLSKFDCCLTPDFSLYTEMPVAMQIWNVYRSRLIGQIMQNYGIKVIPTLSWCKENSFDFCFDGIMPGGVVSVSTIGVKRSSDATKLWFMGMDEAIKRLKPRHVIVYGGDIGYKFKCGVSYISNHNAEKISKKE